MARLTVGPATAARLGIALATAAGTSASAASAAAFAMPARAARMQPRQGGGDLRLLLHQQRTLLSSYNMFSADCGMRRGCATKVKRADNLVDGVVYCQW